MNHEVIDRIRREVSDDIRLKSVDDKLRIGTPLLFDDGDHCTFFLIEEHDTLVLSDLGDVLTRASYEEANLLGRGHRPRFDRLMSFYGMRETEGQITMPLNGKSIGKAIFTFAQGALELVRLAKMPAEKKKRAEKQLKVRLGSVLRSTIAADRLSEEWHDPQLDPHGYYPVDYHVAAQTDWYLFAVGTHFRALHATMSCQHYKLGGRKFKSVAIYRDRDSLPKSAVAPLTDVVDVTLDKVASEKALAEFINDRILSVA